MTKLFLLILISAVASWGLTVFFMKSKLGSYMIDIPNIRSSHDAPKPNSGGLAIVIPFLLVVLVLGFDGTVETRLLVSLLGSGALVAFIGFVDDFRHIAIRWRLLVHILASVWAISWMGGFPIVSLFDVNVDVGVYSNLFGVVYLVWMLNLYNFMDGIDGIASIEAISVSLCAAVLMWYTVPNSLSWVLPLVLAATVSGFVCWNLPPARLFMGDAGSYFLGIVLGLLSIESTTHAPQLFWSWVILLGVFIVDATFTLILRVFRGEKFYLPHRSHTYQIASQKFKSHGIVTLAVLAINILWLFPISYLVALNEVEGILGVFIAYAPLIYLASYYKEEKVC